MSNNTYNYYAKLGMLDEKNEKCELKKEFDKQLADILFDHFLNNYSHLEAYIIYQAVFNAINASYLTINNEDLKHIINITIFAKKLSYVVFNPTKNNEVTEITIPNDLSLHDLNFLRQLNFDYGLRMHFIDNKIIIFWEYDYSFTK